MTTTKIAIVLALVSTLIACGGIAPSSNYPNEVDNKPQAIQCPTDTYADLSLWHTLGNVSFEVPQWCQRATKATVKINRANGTGQLYIGNLEAHKGQTFRLSARVSAPDTGLVYVQAIQGTQVMTSAMNQPVINLETKVGEAPLSILIYGQAGASSTAGYSFSVEDVDYTIQ